MPVDRGYKPVERIHPLKLFWWGTVDIFVIGLLIWLMAGGYVFYGLMALIMKAKRSKLPLVLALLFLLMSGAGFAVLMLRAFGSQPYQTPGSSRITVSKGMTARKVARVLEQKNLIPGQREFLFWAKWFRLDRRLKAGRYRIERGSSIVEILRLLSAGLPFEEKVTLPEGLIIPQIASRLARDCGIDSTDLVKLAYDAKFASDLGVHQGRLEGYLYPDTYQFMWGTDASMVLRIMVDRFEGVYARFAGGSVLGRQYSKHEIVTLASIVEKETGVGHERARIARVFWNRLDRRMTLGADPTVRYAIGKFTGPLTVSNLHVDSPYNTRRFPGLPPGPICSPGGKALQATLHPIATDELYFVAKDDGSNEHTFTKTLREHVRAKHAARRERMRRGKSLFR